MYGLARFLVASIFFLHSHGKCCEDYIGWMRGLRLLLRWVQIPRSSQNLLPWLVIILTNAFEITLVDAPWKRIHNWSEGSSPSIRNDVAEEMSLTALSSFKQSGECLWNYIPNAVVAGSSPARRNSVAQSVERRCFTDTLSPLWIIGECRWNYIASGGREVRILADLS